MVDAPDGNPFLAGFWALKDSDNVRCACEGSSK